MEKESTHVFTSTKENITNSIEIITHNFLKSIRGVRSHLWYRYFQRKQQILTRIKNWRLI